MKKKTKTTMADLNNEKKEPIVIDNTSNVITWLERGLKLIKEYGIGRIVIGALLIAVLSVFFWFIFNPSRAFEVYDEWKKRQHDTLMELRMENAPKIQRAIENLTGVELIIDDTPDVITVSGFDPVRREIARIALEKLISDGRIHPARIEEMVEKARRDVELEIKKAGEKAIFETGVHGLHPELIKLLGRMKYRTSYGQNALRHSIEVSMLAGVMAEEMGVDATQARRAGLLHDIGKALTAEVDGSHVQLGVEVAQKYRENKDIIHAIEAHHNDIEAKSALDFIIQAADAISAARPGARREDVENYIKRLQKLEEVAGDFEGVEKTFAIQAGREVRIMVKPEVVSDDKMKLLARDIAKKIEESLDYPGQIKVSVIRESRHVDYAK